MAAVMRIFMHEVISADGRTAFNAYEVDRQ
jgi:hypothetical protein